ncbi:MAG TPA: NAD-dependent epimerase/dehydratase family protein [Ramlibacter sp.]|uniref:NAD-dependent epimerase/dehydratase family protein n=1 Tax=Ramlibacter sp. TaxID=1917967 RepID=UPI002BDFA034|nr:NAD-dependent epimerase/dehydratase family protein [Ramlibacter sp.]HVZ43035.1 NAD-dependent epimerase/dehydratase family protein [Ramlibacter sp.]
MKLLVTGVAGFIGMHACRRLVADGHEVTGIDDLNAYYDPALKHSRLEQLQGLPRFRFERADIAHREAMEALFAEGGFEAVVHLAAQAGVRYSLDAPFAYADSNLRGMLCVLEGCRRQAVKHLVYASSSSVYGRNTKVPFSETDAVDHPSSLYAATKRADELMAEAYSHLYRIPATGLRFFTVYGPWGRPDMAYFLFTQAILAGQPIKVFNEGRMQRDFTYIDDAVEGIVRVLALPPQGAEGASPHRVLNLGNSRPQPLDTFIALLEKHLGRTAQRELLPMQPGDVESTFADMSAMRALTGFHPATALDEGLGRFVAWYRQHYNV